MRAASRRAASGASVTPISSSSPRSAPNLRPASSSRVILPAASVQTRRAPTSTAVIAITWPSLHTAILEVPPPTSTFITAARSRIERATAPEP
jgi:hypothetical protein